MLVCTPKRKFKTRKNNPRDKTVPCYCIRPTFFFFFFGCSPSPISYIDTRASHEVHRSVRQSVRGDSNNGRMECNCSDRQWAAHLSVCVFSFFFVGSSFSRRLTSCSSSWTAVGGESGTGPLKWTSHQIFHTAASSTARCDKTGSGAHCSPSRT